MTGNGNRRLETPGSLKKKGGDGSTLNTLNY